MHNVITFFKSIYFNLIFKTNFLLNYYLMNELFWQEGFLIDFLQKKIVDNWIKKFLIYSSYLLNERFLFDKLIRFYLDSIIWPFHKLSLFEFNNVANTLIITFIFSFFHFFIFFFIYFLIYLF